jgi:hypothetical protein
MAKGGLVARLGGLKPKGAASVRQGLSAGADRAKTVLDKAPAPSPNPMTNLVIADIALRGGGRLLRHLVETTVLKTKYESEKAKNIVKGRGMIQTLVGTAAARVATKSVPGAILVGGGLLAKALYDRQRGRQAAKEGQAAVNRQAAEGESADET